MSTMKRADVEIRSRRAKVREVAEIAVSRDGQTELRAPAEFRRAKRYPTPRPRRRETKTMTQVQLEAVADARRELAAELRNCRERWSGFDADQRRRREVVLTRLAGRAGETELGKAALAALNEQLRDSQ
jgi:hypothetical protein